MSFRWIGRARREDRERRGVAAAGRARSIRRRAVLESLEDRTLLSTSIPINSAEWTPLGPAPILNGQTPGNLPTAGRINGIAADPTNPNTIFIATAGGGIWKTTNSGNNWTPLTDNQPTLFIGSIAMAPSNPNIIYAGTGDTMISGQPGIPSANTLNYTGQGVLKSTDGGSTWTLLNANGKFTGRKIATIVVNPTNPDLVYAAITGPGVNGNVGNTGIWRSTDGGLTWINTTASINQGDAYSSLVMDPANPQVLYAGIGSPFGSASNGVYKTTDGGNTWSLLGGGIPAGVVDGRITLAVSPKAPGTVFASIAGSGQAGSAAQNDLFRMMKTTDGGTTWTDLTAFTPNYEGFANLASALAVDPNNPLIVYAGSFSASANELIESVDGGNSWQDIRVGANGNGPSHGQSAFAFDATGHLLTGNFGGIFRLDNAKPGPPSSVAWSDLNGDLQITQFVSVALDPTTPNIAYGGANFNGTIKFQDSLQWNSIRNGAGGVILVDPNNSQILYHTRSTNSLGGIVERSTDGGLSWSPASSGINLNGTSSDDPSNSFPPMVMDPSNSQRLLLGTDRVYQTTNRGNSWTPISTPGAAGWTSPASAVINGIAVAASAPNTIYATTSDGKIFVTQNNGAAWTNRSIPTVSDALSGIVVDPSNPQVAYVVRSGNSAGTGRVFQTLNGGQNWVDIGGTGTGALPNIPAWSIAVDSRVSGQPLIFVGNDAGVWASMDQGNTWSQFRTGLPNAQVLSLQLDTNLNILAAGTNGRGMFEIKEINPLQVQVNSPTGVVEGTALTNFPIATFTDGAAPDPVGNYSATIVWGDGRPPSQGTITATGTGSFVVTASHTYAEELNGTITITIVDNDGDIAQVTTPVVVADAPLTPNNGFSIASTEGQAVGGTIASFTDANTAAPAADFTAQITWGDGHVSTGTVVPDPNTPGKFNVVGANTYADEGTFPVTIDITDRGGSTATIKGSANVADAPLTSSAQTFSATEGIAVLSTVASFTDANVRGTVSDFTARINWGDGTSVSQGVVSASGNGGFLVSGNHTFLEQGTYQVTVTIIDNGNNRPLNDPSNSVTIAKSTANVADAILTAQTNSFVGTEGQPLGPQGQPNPVIITFSDANPNAQVSDYASVLINWGDGTSSVGTIQAQTGSKFSVTGNHTYTEDGTYTISVPIVDTSGGRPLNDPSDSRVTARATATIVDAPLNGNATTLQGTAGQPLAPVGQPAPVVAQFNDSNPTGPLSDFTATIDWGDGTPAQPDVTPGTISQPGGIGTTFNVNGAHTYTRAGTFTITVIVNDIGGATTTITSTAHIADAALTGSMAPLATLIEGGTFVGTVATFHDANPSANGADFIVPITWGDGNNSLGTVTSLGGGTFTVSGFNTFAEEGAYTVTVDVISLGGSQLTLSGTATVNDAPIVPAAGASISTTEGTAFSGLVATFTESSIAPLSDFSATIDWGDGDTTSGQVVSLGGGIFGVMGNTTFAEEGAFTTIVRINDVGGSTASVKVAADVADAGLTATARSIQAIQGQTFSGVVADFNDSNTLAPASDFTATITWGNGRTSSGQIVALGGGAFQVTGTNLYSTGGQFPLTVVINDQGGSSTVAGSSVHVVQGLTGALTGGQSISRNTRPSFSGTAEPGSTVQLFAVSTTTGATTFLGQTTATSGGTWTLTSVALPEGSYKVNGVMNDAAGNRIQSTQLLPSSKLGPLIIDTTGPTVTSAQFIPAQDQVVITYHDNLSGMNTVALANAANVSLGMANGGTRSFRPAHIALASGPAGSGLVTETVTFNLGGRARAGTYVLTLNGANLTDRAGNRLVEKTFVTFPQTSNSPNPNYVAAFNVNSSGQASAEQPFISLAEQRAAARYLQWVLSRTRTRKPR